MTKERENLVRCTRAKVMAGALAVISAGLIVTSFFIPPRGAIDSSVFLGVGELFAFAALFFAWEAVDRGIDAKITHKDTTIELNNPDNTEEKE